MSECRWTQSLADGCALVRKNQTSATVNEVKVQSPRAAGAASVVADASHDWEWWQSNLYNKEELQDAFRRAGFSEAAFSPFPLAARYLAAWGYIIEARK